MNTVSPSGTRLQPAKEDRLARLRFGVTLSEAARVARLSLARASAIERFPEQAKPEDLARLRAAVSRLAAGGGS